MKEEKLRCPYCGRAFWKKVHNQRYCSDDCNYLIRYFARGHRMTLEEAEAEFMAINAKKANKPVINEKKKKLQWVQVSSSSGFYNYI